MHAPRHRPGLPFWVVPIALAAAAYAAMHLLLGTGPDPAAIEREAGRPNPAASWGPQWADDELVELPDPTAPGGKRMVRWGDVKGSDPWGTRPGDRWVPDPSAPGGGRWAEAGPE
jgi:hypothetical protein